MEPINNRIKHQSQRLTAKGCQRRRPGPRWIVDNDRNDAPNDNRNEERQLPMRGDESIKTGVGTRGRQCKDRKNPAPPPPHRPRSTSHPTLQQPPAQQPKEADLTRHAKPQRANAALQIRLQLPLPKVVQEYNVDDLVFGGGSKSESKRKGGVVVRKGLKRRRRLGVA